MGLTPAQRLNVKENINAIQLKLGGFEVLGYSTGYNGNSYRQLRYQPNKGKMLTALANLINVHVETLIDTRLELNDIKIPANLADRVEARKAEEVKIKESEIAMSEKLSNDHMKTFLVLNQKVTKLRAKIGLPKLKARIKEICELVEMSGGVKNLNDLIASLDEDKPEKISLNEENV